MKAYLKNLQGSAVGGSVTLADVDFFTPEDGIVRFQAPDIEVSYANCHDQEDMRAAVDAAIVAKASQFSISDFTAADIIRP